VEIPLKLAARLARWFPGATGSAEFPKMNEISRKLGMGFSFRGRVSASKGIRLWN